MAWCGVAWRGVRCGGVMRRREILVENGAYDDCHGSHVDDWGDNEQDIDHDQTNDDGYGDDADNEEETVVDHAGDGRGEG